MASENELLHGKMMKMRREIDSKNQEITKMKAEYFEKEKSIMEKMKNQQKLSDDKNRELNEKISSLQLELSKVRVSGIGKESAAKNQGQRQKAKLSQGANNLFF